MSRAYLFHNIIVNTWREGRNGMTRRQRQWGDLYMRLADENHYMIPYAVTIAKELKISRAASSRMRGRIVKKLVPLYRKHEEIEAIADEYDLRLSTIEKDILKYPEYIEKIRGDKGYTHYRAVKMDEGFFTGYYGKTVKRKPRNVPVKSVTWHKPSALSLWWHEKISTYAREKSLPYKDAYIFLMESYNNKWPAQTPSKNRCCRTCGQLLPLGEIIENRTVTTRRKYCSDRCKTYHKRS